MGNRATFSAVVLAAALRAPLALADDPAPPDPGACADPGPGLAQMPADDPSAAARKRAQVRRLTAVMLREGASFSEERYLRYQRLGKGGIALIPLGALSMIAGLALVVSSKVVAPREYYGDDPELVEQGYYNDYQYQQHEKSTHLLVGGLSALFGGALALGAGIALAAGGRSGMKRQELLRRKDEILGPAIAGRWTLQLTADPRSGLVGARLVVAL